MVSTGGRLDATDVTVTDLGTAGNAPEPRPAISFHSGTGGSVVRATFARNTTGLQLQQTQDVRLEDVTVTDSTADGLALSGDRGTTVNRVRAERNGGNGVRFDGTTTDHPITGITTSGNGRFGVAAVRLQNARIEDLHTTGDASGGLELSRAANVTISGLTAVDEPIGVFAHIGSTGITLDRLGRPRRTARGRHREDHHAPRAAVLDVRCRQAGRRRRSAVRRWSCATWR